MYLISHGPVPPTQPASAAGIICFRFKAQREPASTPPPTPASLIGRGGPHVTLFCEQRIKAAAAALGTVLPRLGSQSLGRRVRQLRRAAPGRLAAEEAPVLFPCRAAETEGGIHSCRT